MNALKIFTDYRQFQIFILGAFSGMPLYIIYSTLAAWLTDEHVDIAIITTFAIARVFYSFKVFWAPIVDQIKIPVLSKIGHRKSWMIVCASAIAFILFSMGNIKPNESLHELYILVIILGFASATFDIVFDAFRIEKLEPELQALGAANAVTGYQIGGLLAGAGAFYYADLYGWSSTFFAIGTFYATGVLFILSVQEKEIIREKFKTLSLHSWKVMTLDPFIDFFKRDGAVLILSAIIFFKLGDAFLGVVATPFYMKLGFSKSEISSVVKIFGLGATLLGTYIGGYLMYRLSPFKGLIIGAIAQSITNVSFIWLNHMGHDINAFMVAIAIENIASGMGTAALVGYISMICNKQFSATQYALLSSASGLFSHSIVMYGGKLVKLLDWDMYFLMTIIMAVPGILILIRLNNKYGNK
jgi:PAT family beta-lactamase induction signal transducer AmpG